MLAPLRAAFEHILGLYAPRRLAEMRYMQTCKKRIDWNHPHDINEKINWLKFYGDTSLWPVLADKYRVRAYVERRGLGQLLVPLLGKWDRAENIDWDSLPQQFVMKTNHGNADVLICHDKSTLDTQLWTRKYRYWTKRKFGTKMAEPHYDKIKPCIIAEQLLDSRRQAFPSQSLVDYKIWAFDGQPAYICVYYDRTPERMRLAIFDTQWQQHPEFVANDGIHLPADRDIPPPQTLQQMLDAAALLSKGLPQVRVDLYEVDGKLYFGELTLTAAAGYIFSYTQEFLDILGERVKIE